MAVAAQAPARLSTFRGRLLSPFLVFVVFVVSEIYLIRNRIGSGEVCRRGLMVCRLMPPDKVCLRIARLL